MAKPVQILAYVSPELKRKAKVKAAQEDIAISGLLSEWLRLWVEGKLYTPNIKKEKIKDRKKL